MEYKVLRQHWGDKQYVEGEMRYVRNKKDAEQLARLGLIAEEGVEPKQSDEPTAKTKAAPAPKNKMAAEPDNKTE